MQKRLGGKSTSKRSVAVHQGPGHGNMSIFLTDLLAVAPWRVALHGVHSTKEQFPHWFHGTRTVFYLPRVLRRNRLVFAAAVWSPNSSLLLRAQRVHTAQSKRTIFAAKLVHVSGQACGDSCTYTQAKRRGVDGSWDACNDLSFLTSRRVRGSRLKVTSKIFTTNFE